MKEKKRLRHSRRQRTIEGLSERVHEGEEKESNGNPIKNERTKRERET